MPTDASHKLIPMTTFVIEYYSNEGYADLQTLRLMNNYANFLKQPLILGMFVPVDPQGNVLKEPKNYAIWKSLEHNDGKKSDAVGFEEYKIYQTAERNCLFKGFELVYNGYSVVRIIKSNNNSVELSFSKNDLKCSTFKDIEAFSVLDEISLTAKALKTIGIKK